MRYSILRGMVAAMRQLSPLAMTAALAFFAAPSLAAPCAGFTDVESTDGFCANVAWLKNRSITLGCTSTTLYCPGATVSRLQMAAFMNRLGTALTPALLRKEDALASLDLDANPVVCQTSDFTADDFPRTAYADASFSATALADVALAARLVMSLDGGANWSDLGLFASRGSVPAGQWGLLTDLGSSLLESDQVARWGLRVSRDGAGADLGASRCHVRVRVFGRDDPPAANVAPTVNAGADQTITLPAQANLAATVGDDGRPNPPAALTLTWSKVSGPGTVTFGNANAVQTSATFSVDGVYVLRLTASDSALSAADDVQVTVQPVGAPPVLNAPPIEPSLPTNVPDSTVFLYTGPNAVQTGVIPGTIVRERSAVVRGRVLKRDGTPLPNAVIAILGRPEFGQTRSRADGAFDLALNGGQRVTLNYAATGFLGVQRRVDARWLDYSVAPDVVMTPLDTLVTAVAANAGAMQVHAASTQTDSAGTRKAVLMFAAATTAQMRLPNGSTAPLATLNVRATEYTVGPNGPSAMPGALPRDSAYTYAAELSVDEAMAAGATSVEFSQPVAVYVDNFLGFPTGIPVPTGYYDRAKGKWIAAPDGRVISITAINGGVADVDTVGTTGNPPLTLPLAERQQLAVRYSVGKSLWRSTVTHFTPWDLNWPYVLPADAAPPNQPPPRTEPEVDRCGASAAGSIIECQNQVLRQSLPIAGTSFTLNYASANVPAHLAENRLRIPVSGSTLPGSVKRIEVTVDIAGRSFAMTAPGAPNQTLTLDWDGKDAYGRQLLGRQPVTGRISYVYDAVYSCLNVSAIAIFARPCSAPTGVPARIEQRFDQAFRSTIGTFDARGVGLGGWTIDQHLVYDPVGLVLHHGDGRRSSATSFVAVINTIGGGGTDVSNEGEPATQARLGDPQSLLIGPDGSVYFIEEDLRQIRRIRPDGTLQTIAGSGSQLFNGDGLPALQTGMFPSGRMAFAPDGTLHFIDGGNRRIRRINADGTVTTIAGTGGIAFNGEGIPATSANMNITAGAIAFASDGTLYLTDRLNQRVRRIDTDGIITTVAGNGTEGYNGDGIPAAQASLAIPDDLAIAPDGSLLIADFLNHRVRRVGLDGIITTVAGTGDFAFNGDGLPATQTNVRSPQSIVFAPDGSLYINEGIRVRRIDGSGIATTVAGGTGASTFNGDGIPATRANVIFLDKLAVDTAGVLYLAFGGAHDRIRTIRSPLPGFGSGDLAIPSEDGRRVDQFNSAGRHLRTIDSLTGGVIFEYTYDGAGRLATIVEKTGGTDNVTTIQRNAGGVPTAIVAPFGQVTQLLVDGNGFLSRVTNPASEATNFVYTANGLMQTVSDPRGGNRSYAYDALGRLTQATDPLSGVQTYARAELPDGHAVTRTSPLGRTTEYRVENLVTGDMRLTTTNPGGETTVVLLGSSGTSVHTAPDGTQVSTTLGPDPRFGMLSPVATRVETKTPAGLTKLRVSSLTATLADPSNPLSLTQLTRSTTINGATATSTYTAANRTTVSTSPAARTLTTVVDALGRIVSRQTAGLSATTVAYDTRGRIASATIGSGAGSRATLFAYAANGYLQSVTDPAGRITTYARDAVGRVTSKTLPDGRIVGHAFDAAGNLASITPPGRTATQYAHSLRDDVAAETPPAAVPGGATSFVFDADGALQAVQRPDGRNVAIVYDGAGRPVARQLSTGGSVTHTDTVARDASGRVASLGAADGVGTAYSYDGAFVTSETVTGPVPGVIAQTFDNFLRVASRAVNGSSIALAYDADGLMTNAGALTIVRSPQHGLATSASLGNVSTTFAYDAFGSVTQTSTTHSGAPVFAMALARDALGRITQKTETIGGVAVNFVYTYDLAGRITGVTRNGAAVESYAYDSNGNRVSATVSGTTIAATYDVQDRLVQYGNAAFTHSAAGDRQQRTLAGATTTYQYDQQRSLRGATLSSGTVVAYLIDGNGRRVGKRVNGTLVQGFLYNDSLRPVAELNGAGAVVSRFVYARGSTPAYMVKGGATFRIVTDQVGSVRLVVDAATGAVAQRLDYDTFGNVTTDTSPGFQPFGFAGGVLDRDTGFVRFGARDYDPATGRWTTKDPAGYTGGSTNLYGYASDDPANRFDPAGHQDQSVAVPEISVDPAQLVEDIIAIVSADPAFVEYADSVFKHVPGISSGAMRNFFISICDAFSAGNVAACDPHEDSANRYVCTGIAEEAIELIKKAMADGRLEGIADIDQLSRRVDTVDHTAVVITLADGTTMVLDWHFSLDPLHPLVVTPEQWCMGGCL